MTHARDEIAQQIDRRRFIATTACAALAGAAGNSCPAAEAPGSKAGSPWQMRLSTSSIHFMREPVENACQRIAKLGFDAVDIWSAHAGCPHLDDVQKRLGAAGLKQTLAELNLKLFAFSVYQGGYPRYAELLGQSGGGVAVRGSSRPAESRELVPRMRAFLENLKPEIELAEKYDSLLAIENHGHALLDSIDSLKAFADLNQSPRLGVALAPYHLQASGASVEKAIEICGNQLFFFYAWQRAKGVAQLPGHGDTDFTPWLAALAKIRYRGHVNPFMHGDLPSDEMSRALGASRDYLTKCFERAVHQTPQRP